MRKGLNLSVMASAVLLTTAGVVNAADHPDITAWTATSGKIDYASMCTAGTFTCSETASGSGFVQLQVTNNASKGTYIVTVVTDPTASGNQADLAFSDQSVVKVNFNNTGLTSNTQSGIIAVQKIQETNASTTGAAGDTFTSLTNINTSSFAPGAAASTVSIQQDVVTAGTAGSNPKTNPTAKDFVSSFWYQSTGDGNGNITGMKMEIDQFAGLQDKGGSANDVQAFTLREVKGTAALTAAGSVTLPGATNSNPANTSYPSDATVSWTAGQDVKAIWLGQNVSLNTTGGPFGSTFGYLSFENVTDKTYATRASFEGFASNQAQVQPWNATFNVQGQTKAPCLSSPGGANCN